jgi:hypothetical protein
MRRIVSFMLALSLLFTPAFAQAQNTSNLVSTDVVRVTRVDANGNGTPGAIAATKLFDGIGAGYFSGAAVTQATSRTTGVTINSYAGAITLFTAAGAATAASFTVTNSKVNATDTIVLSVKSSTTNLYEVFVTAVGAGSFQITFFTTGGTTSDAPVINFAVVRSAAS